MTFGASDTETIGSSTTGPVNVINTDGAIDLGVGSNVITGTGIVLNGGANTLAIQTTGDSIRFNGAVTLQSDLALDTDATDDDSHGGAIVFTNDAPIDSQATEHADITIDVGTSSVTFNENLGETQSLGALTVTEADAGVIFGGADIETIGTGGAGPVNVINTDDAIDLGVGGNVIGGAGIVLNGGAGTLTIQTTGDAIRFNGATTLSSSVVLDTDSTDNNSQGGIVTFTNDAPIDSELDEHNDFTIDVGTASIVFNEDIGATNRIGAFTVTEADNGVVFGGADTETTGTGSTGPINVISTDGAIDFGVGTNVIGGTGIVLNGGADLLTIQTTGDAVRFNGATTLKSDVAISTNASGHEGGDITFTNDAPIDSQSGEHNDFTLDAGTASITFNENIGELQSLGDFTVTRADAGLVFGGADTETIGSSTTGPVNVINTDGAMNFGVGDNVIEGLGIVLNGGANPIVLTTTNDNVRFNGAVTLRSDVRINTGSGAGDITFTNDAPIDSEATENNDLTLNAGTGTIRFNEDIGATTALGLFTIENASQVIFGEADLEVPGTGSTGPVNVLNTVDAINIGSLGVITDSNAATGDIVFNGGDAALRITTTGDQVRLNGSVQLRSDVELNSAGGDMLFTRFATLDSEAAEANDLTLTAAAGRIDFNANIGTLDAASGTGTRLGNLTVNGTTGTVTFGGADSVNGDLAPVTAINTDGAINLGEGDDVITGDIVLNGSGNELVIQTSNDRVRFNGAVTLASNVRIDSNVGNGTQSEIVFTNDAPLDSQSGETNNLTLNAGTGSIKFNEDIGATQRLGSFTIENADRVIFGESDTETVSAGSTGPVNVINTNGAINLGSQSVITNGIVLNGGATPIVVTTTSDAVRFNGAVTAASDVEVTTNGGDILFTNDAPLDSEAAEHNDVTLDAGTAAVRFNEDIGVTQSLGKLTIKAADAGVFFGEAETETVGSGATGPVDVINTDDAINIGSDRAILGGIFLNAGSDQGAANHFTITTTDDDVRFNGIVTVESDHLVITTGAAGAGDITFDVDLLSEGNETTKLTLTSGTGDITFNKIVGTDAKRFDDILITLADDVTAKGNIKTSRIHQLNGTGTTTIEQTIHADATDSVDLTNIGTNQNLAEIDPALLFNAGIYINTNAITFEDAGKSVSTTHEIRLRAVNDIRIAELQTPTFVSIESTQGGIIDNTAAETANITAHSAALRAALGIGDDRDNDPTTNDPSLFSTAAEQPSADSPKTRNADLDLNVDLIAANNTGSGDIILENHFGAPGETNGKLLTVGTIDMTVRNGSTVYGKADIISGIINRDAAGTENAQDELVWLTNNGAIRVGTTDAPNNSATDVEGIFNSAGGSIILTTHGTTDAHDITLNAPVEAIDGRGSILINAGDDIVSNSRILTAIDGMRAFDHRYGNIDLNAGDSIFINDAGNGTAHEVQTGTQLRPGQTVPTYRNKPATELNDVPVGSGITSYNPTLELDPTAQRGTDIRFDHINTDTYADDKDNRQIRYTGKIVTEDGTFLATNILQHANPDADTPYTPTAGTRTATHADGTVYTLANPSSTTFEYALNSGVVSGEQMSANGVSVPSLTPLLLGETFVSPQIESNGFASISGRFARFGEMNFRLLVSWGDDTFSYHHLIGADDDSAASNSSANFELAPPTTVLFRDPKDDPDGTHSAREFYFEHFYSSGNLPDPTFASKPITVRVFLQGDPNIVRVDANDRIAAFDNADLETPPAAPSTPAKQTQFGNTAVRNDDQLLISELFAPDLAAAGLGVDGLGMGSRVDSIQSPGVPDRALDGIQIPAYNQEKPPVFRAPEDQFLFSDVAIPAILDPVLRRLIGDVFDTGFVGNPTNTFTVQPNSVGASVLAKIPGTGIQSPNLVAFFEIENAAPSIAVPTSLSNTGTFEFRAAPIAQVVSAFESETFDEQQTAEERVVWLQVLTPEGQVVAEVQLGEDVLENLPEQVYKKLPDGQYRLQLQEPGESRRRLLLSVTIRNGKPSDEASSQRDRPPTQQQFKPMAKPAAQGEAAAQPAQPTARESAAIEPRLSREAIAEVARLQDVDAAWGEWGSTDAVDEQAALDLSAFEELGDEEVTEVRATDLHPSAASAVAAVGLVMAYAKRGEWKNRVDELMAQWDAESTEQTKRKPR